MTDPDCLAARRALLDASRGRLSEAEHRALDEHLAACPECRALERRERTLDAVLEGLPRRPAPAGLEARLRASLGGPPVRVVSKHTARWQRSGPALALVAAAFALAIGIGIGSLRGQPASERLVAEAVNDHLRVLYAQRGIEIESGGIHQVKPWFEGRLDFAPRLDFEGNDDFSLAGGSVGYFIDRKAAVFVFHHRLHVITLFEFRAEGLPWPALPGVALGRVQVTSSQARGFQVLAFREGDLGYVLVSDVESATLERLGALLVPRAP